MIKITKYIINLYLLFICFVAQAQTFFTEDFNSYPTGHLNTVYDDTTPGQGGWLVSRGSTTSFATGMITAEAGKGNVLTITTGKTTSTDRYLFRQDYGFLTTLWNNRTPGNNILQFEYEFYGVDDFNFVGITVRNPAPHTNLISTAFQNISSLKRVLGGYYDGFNPTSVILKNYYATGFPQSLWIKAEMFVDYNANNVYFYIPTLNIQLTAPLINIGIPDHLDFIAGSLKTTSVVKIDNIKISGLKTLPSYILSTNEQLAEKFNMYPNPATNLVNITNSENMQVQQVTIYDSTGKQLSTQVFNNQVEIQLNVENLASDTYQLYLQTKEGIAVKKLVKK